MNPAHTVAEALARLVEALLYERPEADRERALGATLHAVIQSDATTLAAQQLDLIANGTVVPPGSPGVPELAAQLRGHEVASLTIGTDASPAELLAVAEQLASEPRRGEAAHAFARALIGSGVNAISATYDTDPRLSDILRPTPLSSAAVDGTATTRQTASLEQLLDALDQAITPGAAMRILDELVPFAERAADRKDGRRVAEILARVFRARTRAAAQSEDMARKFGIGTRRIARGLILQHVVPLMTKGGDEAKLAFEVLVATGDAGAQLLVERLPVADSRAERRILFDALVQLRPGPEVLRWLLNDPRWFVVRNGLDLATELGAKDLVDACIPLVRHADDRVRRSAVQAIGRFATPSAVRALEDALADPAAQVRAKAAVSLGTTRHPRATQRILAAINNEGDPEVLTALHVALGRMGTAEAVGQLIEGAKPGGLIFGRKSTAMRVAALQGLAQSAAPQAREALDELEGDKDPEVRAALQRIKRPSRSMTAVSDTYFSPDRPT